MGSQDPGRAERVNVRLEKPVKAPRLGNADKMHVLAMSILRSTMSDQAEILDVQYALSPSTPLTARSTARRNASSHCAQTTAMSSPSLRVSRPTSRVHGPGTLPLEG